MQQLSHSLPWELAQEKWSSALNPILGIPMLYGNQLVNIPLPANTPVAINHLLARMPQGWFLTDNTANCNVWRSSAFTSTKLTLTASAATTVSIWVF